MTIDTNSPIEAILALIKKQGWGFFENPMGENRIFVQTRMSKADARREWRYSTTCGSVSTGWEKRAPSEVHNWIGRLKYIPVGQQEEDRKTSLHVPSKTYEEIKPRERIKTIYATLANLVNQHNGVLDLKEAKTYLNSVYGDNWRPDSQGAASCITATIQKFNNDNPDKKAIDLWPENKEKQRGNGFRYVSVISLDPKHTEKVLRLDEKRETDLVIPKMMSSNELFRVLTGQGFDRVADKGGHWHMVHADGRSVQIPAGKSQFPKATYYSMLKQAGLRKSVEA